MRVMETFPTFYQELVQLWVITRHHQAFLKKNIRKVSDLLTESGSFLTWQMAKQKITWMVDILSIG